MVKQRKRAATAAAETAPVSASAAVFGTLEAPDSMDLTDWMESLTATLIEEDHQPEHASVPQGEQWTSDDVWLCHLLGQLDVFPEDWEFHAHYGASSAIDEARKTDN